MEQLAQDTITSRIKTYLDAEKEMTVVGRTVPQASTQSVLATARGYGLTLREYVDRYADEAVLSAEGCVTAWEDISAQAVLTGLISTDEGNVKVTKEIAALIKDQIERARKDLATVYALLESSTTGGTRKDVLVSALYKRALDGKDTRALLYLIDRVEGRVGENKVIETDYDNAYNVYQILHYLFDKQLEVLNSGKGTKVIMCSRRSGKTMLAAAEILITCLSATNTQCIYIGETMTLAEQLLGGAMQQIIEDCKLKGKDGKKLNWRKFDNGSNVLIRGLSNTKDPDLIRGNKAKLIVIDEFFHLKSDLLEYLQSEVLEPMQLDYADSYKQLLIGTPAKIKGTFGDKVWDTMDIPHFHWYAKENPHIKDFDEFVRQKCIEKGLYNENGEPDIFHPYIQREYFGNRVYDTDALLYPEYTTFSADEVIPEVTVDTILCGLDYGMSDNDAIIGIAWSSQLRRGFVFYESKFNRLTVDKSTTMLNQLKKEVRMLWQIALDFFPSYSKSEANKRVLWEADSSDQQLSQELMNNVHLDEWPDLHLRIANAHKYDKVLMQDKIRDLLRTGALLLPQGGPTARECEMTIMKRDPNGNILPEIDDKTFHPDLLPAMRYALWNAVGQEVLREKTVEAKEHSV